MNYIKIILFFSLFFILPFFSSCLAMERTEIIGLSKKIIYLYESYDEQNINGQVIHEIEQDLSDIKDIIQSELKAGNRNAGVDIFLFLNGIIRNDLLSLQSLISLNNIELFPKDLAQLISFSSAQKLSYALKENKISQKTKIRIRKDDKNKKCEFYVNGFLLDTSDFIEVPVGIPLYFGVYCPNNIFEVQYIQSAETQSNISLQFNNLKKVNPIFSKKQNSIPNPNEYQYKDETSDQKANEKSVEPHSSNIRDSISFGIGLGFIKDYGYLKEIGAKNLNYSDGVFLLSNSYFRYKQIKFLFDFSKFIVNYKREVIFIYSKNKISNNQFINYHSQAYFFRPALGIETSFLNLTENSFLTASFFVHYAYLFAKESKLSRHGFGVSSSIASIYKISSNFACDFSFGASYSIGKLNGFQLSMLARLSYDL